MYCGLEALLIMSGGIIIIIIFFSFFLPLLSKLMKCLSTGQKEVMSFLPAELRGQRCVKKGEIGLSAWVLRERVMDITYVS